MNPPLPWLHGGVGFGGALHGFSHGSVQRSSVRERVALDTWLRNRAPRLRRNCLTRLCGKTLPRRIVLTSSVRRGKHGPIRSTDAIVLTDKIGVVIIPLTVILST